MSKKRILGIVLLLVGICAVLFSGYIYGEVEKGRGQISSAQGSVDRGNKLLSRDPTVKKITAPITSSIQKQIDEGTMEADHYEMMAHILQVGGVLLLIGGGIVLFMSFQRKNRN